MNIRQWPGSTRQKSRLESTRTCDKNEVCDYQLVGELDEDTHKLLLKGADGRYYAYDLLAGDIVALDLDDSWSDGTSLTTSPTHLPR